MKNQTCCFTGHRIIPENEYSSIQKLLEEELLNLIHQGVTCFKAGGALGFDTLAALTVLKIKSVFPHIRLILVLPYRDQTKAWNEKDKEIYSYILGNSYQVIYTSEYYYRGCMHVRNRHLVHDSGICICYLIKKRGGTAYTVDYAKKKGLRIIPLV